MVFVDLCENEIADMVESFYRNGDGSSRILTNRAVGEISYYIVLSYMTPLERLSMTESTLRKCSS